MFLVNAKEVVEIVIAILVIITGHILIVELIMVVNKEEIGEIHAFRVIVDLERLTKPFTFLSYFLPIVIDEIVSFNSSLFQRITLYLIDSMNLIFDNFEA